MNFAIRSLDKTEFVDPRERAHRADQTDVWTFRRLDQAVLVDAAVGGQRADQTDVRAFRGLDGANAAVVRVVHVADFEARAIAAQAARPES